MALSISSCCSDWRTSVAKMVKFSVPPGYVRKKPPARPKLDPFILVIDGILLDDKSRPKKRTPPPTAVLHEAICV